jgi:hypothetical protein
LREVLAQETESRHDHREAAIRRVDRLDPDCQQVAWLGALHMDRTRQRMYAAHVHPQQVLGDCACLDLPVESIP